MMTYSKKFEVLWVDVDMNGHLQHTAYSRYATNVRVGFFRDALKINFENFGEQSLGPIVIREFIEYKREVRLNDIIEIDMALAGVSANCARWLIRHQVHTHGKIACVINMEGAWLDLKLRKMGIPDYQISKSFDTITKTKDFKTIDRRDRLSMSI